MSWAILQHTKKQVDRAGQSLAAAQGGDVGDLQAAFRVISNWRAAHAFPLNTFQMGLRKRAQRVFQGALIAQRLKRLPTMIDKLRRMPNTPLSRFQDIGGCRAVVRTMPQLLTLRDMYRRSRMKHQLVRERDYVSHPRDSGYRCIHVVYRFVGRDGDGYDGLQIEIQLRTQIQHAWATAVETVGTLIDQSLKSSEGSADWLRFFALVSSAFAFVERTPPVPDTPSSPQELHDEILGLLGALKVYKTLDTYRHALKATEQKGIRDASFFLLSLDPLGQRLQVSAFREDQFQDATNAYTEEERNVSNTPGAQVVLVGSHSLSSLRKAYPNYFLDTELFIQRLDGAMRRLRSARAWPNLAPFRIGNEPRSRQGQLF